MLYAAASLQTAFFLIKSAHHRSPAQRQPKPCYATARTGSASDWCALREVPSKRMNTIQVTSLCVFMFLQPASAHIMLI